MAYDAAVDIATVLPPVVVPIHPEVITPTPLEDLNLELAPATPETVKFVSYATKYPPPFKGRIAVSGQYIGTYSPYVLASKPGALRAYYMPFPIPYPLIIKELSIYIKASVDIDKEARLGIFASERGKIGQLIDDNIIALNTIGIRQVPFNVSLSAGMYFLCYFGESSTIEIIRNYVYTSPLGYANAEATVEYTHYYNDIATFATGLSSDPVVTLATGKCPHIFAKVEV